MLDHPPLWVTAPLSARPALGEDRGRKGHVARALRQHRDDGIGPGNNVLLQEQGAGSVNLEGVLPRTAGASEKVCVLVREGSPTLREMQVAGRMSVDPTLRGFSLD